jgi:hypothetical protein
MNSNGDGAIYAQTLEPITVMVTAAPLSRPEISRTVCDVIAGIIFDWASTFYMPLPLIDLVVSGVVI